MNIVVFAFPGNEELTAKFAMTHKATLGHATFRHFPDGETYTRIDSDVEQKHVVVICTMHQPDGKFLLLYFFSKIARELGCKKITLIAPYLSYMRQDKIFQPGEGLTSSYFAELISGCVDELITVDPHLHRITSLNTIYSIPCQSKQASDHLAAWISENIVNPLIIGPDSESEQWVTDVALKAKAHYTVLQKIRTGDREVEISIPQIEKYKHHTPVLVDDIISTGKTMQGTIKHLKNAGMPPPLCIGIHAVFAPGAYEDLLGAGASRVVTCNTIAHVSNQIDISDLLQIR